jgi:TusA-related sulfurtransferase
MKNEEATNIENRVASMTDGEILEIVIDKDGWQEALYQRAIVEAKNRNLKVGDGNPESISKQKDVVIISIQNGIVDGKPLVEIINQLVTSGVEKSIAKESVKKMATEIGTANFNKWNGKRTLNTIIFVGGVFVTAVTYLLAINGGTYFLAYGAILFGGIKAFSAHNEFKKWEEFLLQANQL